MKGTIFKKKKIMEYNMFVSTFSTTFPETFFIIGRLERNKIKMYISLHIKYPLFLSELMKLELSRNIFEKLSNVKFHKNPSIGSRDVPFGEMGRRTNRHDEAHSHFSQFCENARENE